MKRAAAASLPPEHNRINKEAGNTTLSEYFYSNNEMDFILIKFRNHGVQGWRVPYYGAGVVALIIAVLMTCTLREPERKAIGEESSKQAGEAAVPTWKVLLQPRIVLLCIAASIRHCGESCITYSLKWSKTHSSSNLVINNAGAIMQSVCTFG